MHTEELFPTTVACFDYPKHKSIKSLLLDLIRNATLDEINSKECSIHLFEKSGDFLYKDQFKDLHNFFIESAKEYLLKISRLHVTPFISLAWINCANQGFKLERHNHGNSYLSGTYYLNFDPSVHAHLEFYKSVLGQRNQYFDISPFDYNRYNAKSASFLNVKEGNFLLWPSYLEHGFEKNLSDNRITISMNFLPEYFDNGDYKFKISKL